MAATSQAVEEAARRIQVRSGRGDVWSSSHSSYSHSLPHAFNLSSHLPLPSSSSPPLFHPHIWALQEMLAKSREDDSGVKLEVNERILDSCTGLMKAIQTLIQRARDLQAEIITEGMVSPACVSVLVRVCSQYPLVSVFLSVCVHSILLCQCSCLCVFTVSSCVSVLLRVCSQYPLVSVFLSVCVHSILLCQCSCPCVHSILLCQCSCPCVFTASSCVSVLVRVCSQYPLVSVFLSVCVHSILLCQCSCPCVFTVSSCVSVLVRVCSQYPLVSVFLSVCVHSILLCQCSCPCVFTVSSCVSEQYLFCDSCREATQPPVTSTRRTHAGLRDSYLLPSKSVGEPLSLCEHCSC